MASTAPHLTPPPDAPADAPKIFTCGTLAYTKMGLAVLFSWLLWGDFCFTLMEAVVKPSLQLKLKTLGATSLSMSLILSTLPSLLNMTVCPWVSFKSDRHRSRWGRRIPFILTTMPFLVLSLVMLGWSETIAPMLQRALPALAVMAPATVIIGVIAVFMVIFQFFNMFVSSIFWYLFNDVVPPQFLGRFFGLFRLMGTGAGALYNYFIFQYAETHMRQIFSGGALLYLIGFGAMCLFIKEGKYPPPPDQERPKGLFHSIKAFRGQCFSHRFYWYFYLRSAFSSAAGAMAIFGLFFNQQMGLSLDQIGKLAAYGGIAGMLATYFTAVFVDRWHPLRISAYMGIFAVIGNFGGWVWVFVTLPGDVYFWLSLGGLLATTFSLTLTDGCDIPLFMRLMPKSLYGQLSSANALIRAFTNLLAGIAAGLAMDGIIWLCHGSGFAYRFIFLWPWLFSIAAAVFVCLGYREWKLLGGDESYRPPAPWLKEGFEEVADKVPTIPARPRLVMISMWLAVAGSAINVVLVLAFMLFMSRRGQNDALSWYLRIFIPLKLVLTAASYWQLVRVRRDLRARERGESTKYGIPHHGVLLVNAIQGLVTFPVYWYQMVKMIELSFQREMIIFGIATLISTAMGIAGVQIVRWIERDPEALTETSAA